VSRRVYSQNGTPQEPVAEREMNDFPYVYAWANNPVRASLRGRRCRVLVRSRRFSSCLAEFEDGRLVVTSRNALRRPGRHREGAV